jgi:acyl transferase domain-containing protein
MSDERDDLATGGIAIIGMVGRFPGARDLDTFWRNICDGTESITAFKDEDLHPFGFEAAMTRNPNYVKARGIGDDADLFQVAADGLRSRFPALRTEPGRERADAR